MKLNGNNLKIAIQKDGRLTEQTLKLLKEIGLEFEIYKRQLFSRCRNFPLDILFLRDDDIPEYVQDNTVDLGIVGENLVSERNANVRNLEKLGFGYCSLVLAVPQKSGIRKITDLESKRIATSYPVSLRTYLRQQNIQAEIIQLKGSVEIAPSLEIADAICDLRSTGSTIKSNNLKVLETVLESQSVLISSKQIKQKKELERLLIRIRADSKHRKANIS